MVTEDAGAVPEIVVSFSELDRGRVCPHAHDLQYKQRWQPPTVSAPLEIGKLWHSALEAHYRSLSAGGSNSPGALRRARTSVRHLLDASASPHVATIEFMYGRYLDRYGLDSQWKILGVEHELVAPLPWPGHGPRFIVKGRIDLVVREAGRLLIVDHKSHRYLPDQQEYALNDQFALYEFLLNQMGKQVFGSIYNTTCYFIPKSGIWENPDKYMERVPLYRTKEELRTVVEEAMDDLNTLYGYAPGKAPRHPNSKTCKWCAFRDPCISGRKRGEAHERDHLLQRGFRQDRSRH